MNRMQGFRILGKCLIILVATFSFTFALANPTENYSRVKVLFDKDRHTMFTLSRLGVPVDHGDHRKGRYFMADFSESEINIIKQAGFQLEIVIQDVKKHYRDNSKTLRDPKQKMSSVPCDTIGIPLVGVPAHFHLGNYGNHFSYVEMLAILDSMQLLYPNLISVRQPIGSFLTTEGRPIFWLRVSNNPSIEQPAKPQILYTALHHAREPGSLTSTIFYLWHLLENYNTDPQIKAIVDNAELYFIPCVNPDGYIFNNLNAPQGGGMWRKNMRDNQNGTYGVDLNRNYGYMWGFDNFGSSANSNTDVYRGPFAFSEPETQAVKWFTEQHHFGLALNYHTYNNELINPYGHVPVANTPDSLAVSAYSWMLTQYNFYRYGTCYECLGYVANGGSDDWMYGEQTTKNKILAWTPEIGNVQEGFYPPVTQIIPDCKDNLLANINSAALLLPYAKITSADANIIGQGSGFLHYKVQRLGLEDTATYTVSAQALDSWIAIPSGAKTYTNPALLQSILDSFSYTINPATPNNQPIRYVLKINNGLYDLTDTVQFFYAKHFSRTDIPTASLTDWVNVGWSVNTQKFHTAPASLKSSLPNANYPDNGFIHITLKDTIDLKHALKAYLQFYATWDIEPKYDYAEVMVREVGVQNWTSLCGKYTKPGDYDQPYLSPVYDDHQYDWLLEQMDLGPWLGKKINIRVELNSDVFSNYPGIYIDDMQVTTVQDSILNVLDPRKGQFMTVYPNPAADKLTIILDNSFSGESDLALYDAMGRQVLTSLFTQRTTLNIDSLASGIYYLQVRCDGQRLPVEKVQIVR